MTTRFDQLVGSWELVADTLEFDTGGTRPGNSATPRLRRRRIT
jgi:hypothetical protein